MIAEIKSRVPLEAEIGAVIQLTHGKKGLCPFHEDKHPSLSVKGDRWRCWSCGEGGDVIDFVKKYQGINTKAALKYLADRAGIKAGSPDPARIAESRKRRELIEAFRAWEKASRDDIAEVLRKYYSMRATRTTPFSESELQDLARLQANIDYLSHFHEVLCQKDDAPKFELFVQEHGV